MKIIAATTQSASPLVRALESELSLYVKYGMAWQDMESMSTSEVCFTVVDKRSKVAVQVYAGLYSSKLKLSVKVGVPSLTDIEVTPETVKKFTRLEAQVSGQQRLLKYLLEVRRNLSLR